MVCHSVGGAACSPPFHNKSHNTHDKNILTEKERERDE